jgi:hypothetical protein
MKKVFLALAFLAVTGSLHILRAQDLQEILGQYADMTAKATYDPVYNFDAYMQIAMTDRGNNQVVYDAYLTRDGSSYALLFTEGGARSIILFDTENNAVLILTEEGGEKSGFALAINGEALKALMADTATSGVEYADLRTGQTKSILGYSCDEYLLDQEDAEVRIWTSEELGQKVQKEMLRHQQILGGVFTHAAGMNGMVLEYHYRDKSGGEERSMMVTRLDMEASHTISTADYSVVSMVQ